MACCDSQNNDSNAKKICCFLHPGRTDRRWKRQVTVSSKHNFVRSSLYSSCHLPPFQPLLPPKVTVQSIARVLWFVAISTEMFCSQSEIASGGSLGENEWKSYSSHLEKVDSSHNSLHRCVVDIFRRLGSTSPQMRCGSAVLGGPCLEHHRILSSSLSDWYAWNQRTIYVTSRTVFWSSMLTQSQ